MPEHNDHKLGELNAPIVERIRNPSRHLPEICGRKMCYSSGGQFWHPSGVRFSFDGVPGVSLTLNPRLMSGSPSGFAGRRDARRYVKRIPGDSPDGKEAREAA